MKVTSIAAGEPVEPSAIVGATRSESAVSESTYSVPPQFLWLADILTAVGAFLLAWQLMPGVQWIWSAERAGRIQWLAPLSLPPASAAAGRQPLGEIAWIPLVMIPVTLVVMHLLGGYRPLLQQSRTRVVLSGTVSALLGLSVLTLALIALRNQSTSRALIFSFTLLTTGGLVAYRYAIRIYKHRRLSAGCYARNVVLVAPPAMRAVVARHFSQGVSPQFHRLYGYLDVPDAASAPGRLDGSMRMAWQAVAGALVSPQAVATAGGPVRFDGGDIALTGERSVTDLSRLGDVSDLGEFFIHKPIHEVLAVQYAGSEQWLPQVIEQCEYFHVTLRVVPDALLWHSHRLQTIWGGTLQLPEIVLRPHRLDDGALFMKRVFDIVVSSVLLLLLLPVFVAIAVAIKLTTPHLPVLFPWRVIGYKGRAFTGYKFTTMIADAEERKPDLMHLNEMSGPVFKIHRDPRVTPFGAILRKFSLNELPQLWSVLKGDMSLVGPRPAYPNELARYELWHKRKLCVQPGITCLWQIRGRNRISNFDDWVRMDFEYIDNWSLWLDCRILFRTAWVVLAGTGS